MRRLARLFGFALLVLWGADVRALQLSEIITEVRRNVRDTASSTSLRRYSDTFITSLVNEGQRDVINNTWSISKSTTIVTVAGTQEYTLPTDSIEVWRVAYAGRILPELSITQLDADNPLNWQTSTGTVTAWYRNRANSSQFGLYPYPNQASEVVTVTAYYFALATDLSATTDVPFNALARFSAYHDLLTWYATYRILYDETMLEKARAFKDQYDTRLGVLLENYGAKPERVPSVPTKENKQ